MRTSIGASGAVTIMEDEEPMCILTTTLSSQHAVQNGSQ